MKNYFFKIYFFSYGISDFSFFREEEEEEEDEAHFRILKECFLCGFWMKFCTIVTQKK
jgi:hypothetical protein